jgi:hypothetical protein
VLLVYHLEEVLQVHHLGCLIALRLLLSFHFPLVRTLFRRARVVGI